MKTLQLGTLFRLRYLCKIYFNLYNKQVRSVAHTHRHPVAVLPSLPVLWRLAFLERDSLDLIGPSLSSDRSC